MSATPRTYQQRREDDAQRAAQQEAQAYGLFVSQFLFALGEPDATLTPLSGGEDIPLHRVVHELLTEYVHERDALHMLASMLLVVGQTAQGRAPALMAQGIAQALAHAYAHEATKQALERGELPLV